MAANDELPTGLDLSSGLVTNGTAAEVVYPASPKIAWTLTAVSAAWSTTVTYGSPLQFTITVNGEVLDLSSTPTPSVGTQGNLSWTGQLEFPPNTAVTVSFGQGNGVGDEIITASAYPT
jgi:hypothetical protein